MRRAIRAGILASAFWAIALSAQTPTELRAFHLNLRTDASFLFGDQFIQKLTLDRITFDFRCDLEATALPSGSTRYRLKNCVADAVPQPNVPLDPQKLASRAEREFVLRNMQKVPAGPVYFKLFCAFEDGSGEFRCGVRQ